FAHPEGLPGFGLREESRRAGRRDGGIIERGGGPSLGAELLPGGRRSLDLSLFLRGAFMFFSFRCWLNAMRRKFQGRREWRPAAQKRQRPPMVVEQLEVRLTPSTLAIVGNTLTYTATPTETNNLTVSVSGATYTFKDTGATITTGIAGSTGSGTNTVTVPDAGFTSIGIDFTPNVHADTVNIQSVNEATTVLGSNSLTGNTFNVSSNAP